MAYRLRHGSPADAVEPDDSIAARRDRVYIAPAGVSRSEKSEPPTRSSDGRGHTVAQFRAVSGVADGGAAAANVASFRPADPVPPHGHGVGGATGTQADAPAATGFARAVLGIVPTPLLAWRERRFAERICRELLKLHALVSSRQPNLTGRDLYRQIVGVRIGDDAAAVDAAAVDAVLDGAERSFAQWPADRELRFCDIVNYLAATEFLAAHRGSRWIHADMKHIVASRIPREL